MDRYETLALPHNFDAAPNEPAASSCIAVYEPNPHLIIPSGHPNREGWEAVGRRYQEHVLGAVPGEWRHPWDVETRKGRNQYHAPEVRAPQQSAPTTAAASCKVQVVRSVCDWSHGVLTEHSIQNACKMLSRLQLLRLSA